MLADGRGATLVYDGACPFCTRYAALVRLREAVGPVRLVDARSGDPAVVALKRRGTDLDRGMVLLYGGRSYHGADCLSMLAVLGTPVGAFNRINAAVFRSPVAARLLYPLLRAGRGLALRLLGRPGIADR